jgi:hypothetical protein
VAEQIIKLVTQVQAKTRLPLGKLCRAMEVSVSTVRRWRQRRRTNQPLVNAAGPKKVVPFDPETLNADIQGLDHGRHRSHGTGDLCTRYRDQVSRRVLQELVAQTRQEQTANQRASWRQVIWQAPGAIWGLDTTEYKGEFFQSFRDLSARYTFPAINETTGDAVAGHLQYLIDRYGAPLFLKRDNASSLNAQMVNEILSVNLVLPLNSPLDYPRYNGGIERAQGEFKTRLETRLAYKQSCHHEHIGSYAENVAHDLNHISRSALGGRIACEVFWGQKHKHRFTKRTRRMIYDLIKWLTECIVNEMKLITKRSWETAWRMAAEYWLCQNGLITIIQPKVLPYYHPVLRP